MHTTKKAHIKWYTVIGLITLLPVLWATTVGVSVAQTENQDGVFDGEEAVEDIDEGLEIADIEARERVDEDGFIYYEEFTAEEQQEFNLGLEEHSPDISDQPSGAVSCFDYYTFGSVQAVLSASVAGTVSGTSITFSGEIINENPYPVVDGSLYVKVFKPRDADDENGPDVVDQFFAVSDVSIPANGEVPVSFSWQVPSHAISGEYKLATFFVASRKFNLLGLPFTDDVVGNTVNFTVDGEYSGGVVFDKASVTMNEEAYQFAEFPPNFSADEPVVVSARIENSTSREQNASLIWTVYYWDSLLRQNAVQEETQRVRVPAGSSVPVSVTVTDTRYPVYLVVGELSWEDTRSIVAPRFAREGVPRPRINFSGVTTFPLVEGEQAEVFSCLHSTSDTPVQNGRLDLTLLDMDGNLINLYSYEGVVTGAMIGVLDQFTPEETYDKFVLEARLYDNGEFVDEARHEYDCARIDPSLCSIAGAGAGLGDLFKGSFGPTAVGIVLVALLIIVLVARRLFGGNPDVSDTSDVPSGNMPPR